MKRVFCVLTHRDYDVYGTVLIRNRRFLPKVPHFIVWDEDEQCFAAVPCPTCTPVE